ncbi:hypothetical protein C7446_2004 [Kushneria sinocarnis]|uniref:Membrane protein YfhO n=1 Tax=Kushneria sinocarnis TaxID=595502 RepID=A0A420WWI7_9GAMM|nr:6-pyruvoyl-tetrahydropterin synthase-related protein [Kushneria sinocarnis]RKR03479.1 hypothetical protein C7446_2004 [Kushneria sinocarnis]
MFRGPWFGFAGFALLAVIPVVLFGYPWEQYDFIFHFSSWQDYGQALMQGNLHPAWSEQANYGLGSPRHVFYPPLSLLTGGLLSLLLPDRMIGGGMIWLFTLLCSITCWYLAPRRLERRERALVAVLAAFGFGMINTGLIRFAMADMLACALFPLLLLQLIRMRERRAGSLPGMALVAAGMWLADIPLAIASAYLMGMVTLYCCLQDRSPRLLWRYLLAYVASIALVAWYLVPAMAARSWISEANLGVSHRSLLEVNDLVGKSSAVLLISLLALGVCLLALTWWRQRLDERSEVLAVLGVSALLLQMPGVLELFYALPLADRIGYWFRFFFFVSLALPMVAFAVSRARLLRGLVIFAYGLFFLCALYFIAGQGPASQPDNPDYYQPTAQVLKRHQQGFTGYPEYINPATDAQVVARPAERPDSTISASTGCQATLQGSQLQSLTVATRSGHTCTYTLARYAFPWWQIRLDGQALSHGHDERGLLTVTVPAGEHKLAMQFERPLPLVLSGWAITLATLLIMSWLSWRRRAWRGLGSVSTQYDPAPGSTRA